MADNPQGDLIRQVIDKLDPISEGLLRTRAKLNHRTLEEEVVAMVERRLEEQTDDFYRRIELELKRH